jgi:hypothetical protein
LNLWFFVLVAATTISHGLSLQSRRELQLARLSQGGRRCSYHPSTTVHVGFCGIDAPA